MRVTNSMLTHNLLRNLHANFGRSNHIQNMMATGRRFAHISDNPTAMLQGLTARNMSARLSHFQGSVNTADSWLTQAEISTRELQGTIVSLYERLIDAASDVKTESDRNNIAAEIGQLRKHFLDTLNSTFGNNFIFGGFNVTGDFVRENPVTDGTIRPFVLDDDGNLFFNSFNVSQFDGIPAMFLTDPERALGTSALVDEALAHMNRENQPNPPVPPLTAAAFEELILEFHSLKNDVMMLDVGPGIEMPVMMNGLDLLFFTSREGNNTVMRSAFSVITEVYDGARKIFNEYGELEPETRAAQLTELVSPLQRALDHKLAKVAEIGGRMRRLELLEARFEQDSINYRQMRSDAEDVDMAEVIMDLRMAESVLQASMAAGARVIQPSLMDFLR